MKFINQFIGLGVVLVLFFLGTGSIKTHAAIQPVWTDGWLAAGNKTVGTPIRYMRIGQWDQAEKELRTTLSYRPENHAAQFDLGICYERKGDVKTARRFYEKAINLKPEPLYCEAIARLDGTAGTGAEFVKFMKPCSHECDHGYAFARAGLWNRALSRFISAWSHESSALIALNLAVTYEVIGQRDEALKYLDRASALSGTSEFDDFAVYLRNAPRFSLDLRTNLPSLTTSTDVPVKQTMYLGKENIAIRMRPMFDSAVLEYAESSSPVGLITRSGAWARVRTRSQREGYIPFNMLRKKPVNTVKQDPNQEPVPQVYAVPYSPDTDSAAEPSVEPKLTRGRHGRVVHVRKDGHAVAVRNEASILAEIVGYAEPGQKLEVLQSPDPMWYEILNFGTQSCFIMKRYTDVTSNAEELE